MKSMTLLWLVMAIGAAVIGLSSSPLAALAQVLFAAFGAIFVITLALRFGSWVGDRQFRDRVH